MKIVSPKNDFCLKELLSNTVVLRHFISDILGIPSEQIKSLRIRFFNAESEEDLEMLVTMSMEEGKSREQTIERLSRFLPFPKRRQRDILISIDILSLKLSK